MTGKDVYLQMTWSWPDKTWNILCSYCLQWNTSQSKFRNHYFLFLFAFSILSQLFLIWGCTLIVLEKNTNNLPHEQHQKKPHYSPLKPAPWPHSQSTHVFCENLVICSFNGCCCVCSSREKWASREVIFTAHAVRSRIIKSRWFLRWINDMRGVCALGSRCVSVCLWTALCLQLSAVWRTENPQ